MSNQSLSINDLIDRINRGVLGKHHDSYDILTMAALSAAIDSAAYYQERMLTARNFPGDLELLEDALRACSIKGSILEFGVATGRTINQKSTHARLDPPLHLAARRGGRQGLQVKG